MKFRLIECLDVSEKNKILDYIMKNFVTSDKAVAHACFILPNGKFLDIANTEQLAKAKNPPSHVAVDIVLSDVGLVPRDIVGVCGNASKTMRDLNCVRINDNVDYHCSGAYIELPKAPLTTSQYSAISDYIDYLYTIYGDTYKCLQVSGEDCYPTDYPLKNYTSDEIIKKIKRFYASGNLYESKGFITFEQVVSSSNNESRTFY